MNFLSFPQSDAQFLRTNHSQSGEVSDNGEAAPGQHCHERGQGPQLEIQIGDSNSFMAPKASNEVRVKLGECVQGERVQFHLEWLN